MIPGTHLVNILKNHTLYGHIVMRPPVHRACMGLLRVPIKRA